MSAALAKEARQTRQWRRRGWARVACNGCGGGGVVADYGAFGIDFEGPKECPDCGGGGHLWRSPKGALAQYPGGPFRGRDVS